MSAGVLRVFRSGTRRSAGEAAEDARALLGPRAGMLESTPRAHRLRLVDKGVDEHAFELRAWATDADAPAEARWLKDEGPAGGVSIVTTRPIEAPDGYEQVEESALLDHLPRQYLLWGRIVEVGSEGIILAEHRIGEVAIPRSLVTGDPEVDDRLAFEARELVTALEGRGEAWEGNAVVADELLCGLTVVAAANGATGG